MSTQTVTRTGRPATASQIAYIESLCQSRGVTFDRAAYERLDTRGASNAIDLLKATPRPAAPVAASAQALTPGVYRVDGTVYVVKFNQDKTNLYAKRLVEISGDRLTEADAVVSIDFEYAPGAIRSIRPEHRLPLEEGKALTVRYGRCINCGRHLKDAESVERGIGPVCIKTFA